MLKIIAAGKVDLAIVNSINEAGPIRDKKIIAEIKRIFNLLNELGADYAQGYIIGNPLLPNDLKRVKPFFVTSK